MTDAYRVLKPGPLPDADALRRATNVTPGIRRYRQGRGFRYRTQSGASVSAGTRRRIRELVIPPAWREVWICPSPKGHIQATGRDRRGRKQYVYHPAWRALRDQAKYGQLLAFGQALPRIRAHVEADLNLPVTTRGCVTAAAVRLLDLTSIRIGNGAYQRQNGTFGLTTLRREHVVLDGPEMVMRFTGKGGKAVELRVRDQRLERVLHATAALPGEAALQYAGEHGQIDRLQSADVNAYLRAASGGDFTAKTFRTWNASVLAARSLALSAPVESMNAGKRAKVAAVRDVAAMLVNTPAVCRASYIHPAIFDAFERGALQHAWNRNGRRWQRGARDPFERLLLYILQRETGAGNSRSIARRTGPGKGAR